MKLKKNFNLSKQVLYCLAELLGKSIDCYLDLLPRNLSRKVYGSPEAYALEEKFQHERQIKRALREMKRRKLMEIKNIGGRVFCELTSRGIQESLWIKSQLKKNNPKGEYCLVCFDIPETVRPVRWAMRHFLKIAGFKLLQKSIWYTDKDVFDEIRAYIKSLKVDRWVTVIRANSIDGLENIK